MLAAKTLTSSFNIFTVDSISMSGRGTYISRGVAHNYLGHAKHRSRSERSSGVPRI